MTPVQRQGVLARFLTDAEFERSVRQDPMSAAQIHQLDLEFLQRLNQISRQRVLSFRKGRAVKADRRGETPKETPIV